MTGLENAPVAVFDSGIGGIGFLREAAKRMPFENWVYFGDSAHAPYGEKEEAEIRALVLFHGERLLRECKALVLACNTATAVAAKALRKRFPQTPIIGMEPALLPALKVKPHPTVWILATAATLKGEKWCNLMLRYAENATVLPIPAPMLVRCAESGGDAEKRREAVRLSLAPYLLQNAPPDAVVLGCTHFIFLKEEIRAFLGGEVPLFDGVAGTVAELRRRLEACDLLYPSPREGVVTFRSDEPRILPRYLSLFEG